MAAVRFSLSFSAFAFVSSALTALALGCSSAPAGSSCTPGQSNACTCANGDSGAQECGSSGTFEACVCEGDGSGGSGSGTGGSGSGTGGGANGSGGGSSSGGAASGSGGSTSSAECDVVTPACSWLSIESPDTASFKDLDSNVNIAGHYCTKDGTATFVSDEVCPYSEECDLTTNVCTSCGDDGRRTGKRLTNGTVTEDCEGCTCNYWRVHACVADTTKYGEPYAVISFQSDADVFQYDVTPSGQAASALANATVSASNVSADIAANGLVELDAVVDYTFTNLLDEQETWHLEGHVVGRCQE